ncbi:MAG: exonuclease SbcCD subunit D, partial [Dehalococcoidales bacterium]|nr:exonuclease SbcCD subunit D [Dehalococcoidales bacterium]
MKIIHFADLHLGVETYGHINPETGLSTRLEDYLRALDRVVDYALNNRVDLVLFCGDAYKTREPSQTQQREFAKRIKRLTEGGVPLFMLIGNHDLPNALGRATAIEIFDTLSIPGVYVANRPGIHRVRTASGEAQIAALPWVRRSALLSKEDTRSMDFTQINEKLQQILIGIINDMAGKVDPSLPAVLAAHVWVLNARVGSEKGMSIGQEHMLLLGSVANPVFDYIALGHIHKAQVLNENPPTVYSGSLERLDFGDEDDQKGFYLADIDTSGNGSAGMSGRRNVSYQFHSIEARRFYTLDLEIAENDPDPTSTVLREIDINRDKIKDAIVRVEIKFPAALSGKLRDTEIRNKIKDAYYLTISREVIR